MTHARGAALLLSALMLSSGLLATASAATWQPRSGDWPTFRGNNAHTALVPNKAAFTASLSDVRVKWSHTSDLPFFVPPNVGDLDNDGVPEVVAGKGNVVVAPGPPPSFQFSDGWEVLNGQTGAMRCQYGPTTGNLLWFSPAIGDVNADGKADLVFADGNPVAGSFSTNKLYAYTSACAQEWAYSDANWGTKVPNVISAPLVADVDGEAAKNEAVFNVLLATITTSVGGDGALLVQASAPEEHVLAINGESGSPSVSWQLPVLQHGSVNSPALADMNGDGKLDTVYASGVLSGTLFDLGSARVTLSQEFEDHQVLAYTGAASPQKLWSFGTGTVNPGDLRTAPAIADLNGDGKPDVVLPLAARELTGTSSSNGDLVAIGNDGQQLWKTHVNALLANPVAIGDLDADGKPDVVLQTEAGTEGVRVLAYHQDGSLLWRSPQFSGSGVLAGTPSIADITGDGKPEVVVVQTATNSDPTRLVALNGQTGAFLWSKDVDADGTLGAPVIADIDGDDNGRPEIVVNIGSFIGQPALGHSLVRAYEPELPDLAVAAPTFSTGQHALGDAETISAKVTNLGSRTASNAVVRFLDGTDVIAEQTVTIAAGASQTLTQGWTPQHLGARTVRVVADPADAVPEWVETNNDASQAVTVRSVDFRFASGDPVLSDTNPGVGDTITVSGTLTNAGGKNATNVVVRFTDDGATFQDVTVPSLRAGASASVSAPLTIGKGGVQTIRIAADPDAAYVDENPADNAASTVLNVRAPDFAFSAGDPTFSDARPGVGDTITVGATLSNLGGRGGSNVLVRFLDDGAVFSEQTVASIASGASQALSAQLTVQGERNHVVRVVADPDGGIAEENETNNEASKLLAVRFTAPDLALAPGDPQFSDPNPGVGDTITVSVGLRNAGEKAASGAVVRFFDDGAAFADVTVSSLAVGESKQASAPLHVLGLHTHTIRAVADPDNAIQEEDEANNEATQALPVTAPDLSIGDADIALSDPNPDDQDTLTVAVTVHNLGPKPASDVLVQVLDEGSLVASATIASVPGHSAVVAKPSYAASAVGPHNLSIAVDPLDAIIELDEGNNQAAARIVVGKVQPIVTMSSDFYGFQEQAHGNAHLQFRNTKVPLADKELTIPVEYIVRPATIGDPTLPHLLDAVAALVEQVDGATHNQLDVCVAGACVNTTVDQAIADARTLGAGLGGGANGAEFRYRLFTIEATTNAFGDAAFDVPYSLAAGLQGLTGQAMAGVCLGGVDLSPVFDAVGQPPVSCVTQLAAVPGLPAVANIPGTYRASAVVDWYGYTFGGYAEYEHL